MVVVDPTLLSADSLARAFVIFSVGLLLLFSSVITICVLLSNPSLHDVISYYLISLAFSDLICAICIVPLSIYSSLSPNWNFMGDNSLLCKSASYLHVVLISSTIYTYAWVGVDRYSAFMKPARYEIDHTITRCKCWIAFSWITAILLACPMIVAKMEVNYYYDLEMCVLNWSTTVAYSVTMAVLVLLPTSCTVAFTCGSVFAALNKPEELEDSQRSAVDTDENFIVTFFVLIAFILAWLPILVIQLLPAYLIHPADSGTMKFAFMWLAIGGSSSKLLIYIFANREFRHSLCSVCINTFMNNDDDDNIRRNIRHGTSSMYETPNGQKMLFDDGTLGCEVQENDMFVANNVQNYAAANNNNIIGNSNKNNCSVTYNANYHGNAQQQQFLSCRDEKAERKRSSQSSNCRSIPKSTTSSPIAANTIGHVPEYGSFSRSPITYY